MRYKTEAEAVAALTRMGITDPTLPLRRRTPPRHLEDLEQGALMTWRDTVVHHEPRLALLYHIPNGGKRPAATAVWLKAMGVKPGMPDNHLPVAARGYHGCFCELKVGRRHPSEPQQEVLTALEAEGYCTGVYWGWWALAAHLCWYLSRPDLCPEGAPYASAWLVETREVP